MSDPMTSEHTPADTAQDMAAEHAAEDAARAAAARTYPDSWETGRSEALAFIKGAAWQRAQIAARRDEAIRALDGQQRARTTQESR